MSLDMNAAGQIDPIVGKLTIASLDNDVDQLDTEVTPCLSDRAFGDTVALGTVPEPAVNALLGLLGVSPLVEVDGDGVTTVLLNLANTDAATTSALGGVVRSAAEMLGDDPVPARDALVQSLPGV